MKWISHSIFSILALSLSMLTAPYAWADDPDSDDLGVELFGVMGDSDSVDGTLLELQEIGDSDDMDSDSQDSDSDASDSDDSDGDLHDIDSEDDSDGDLDGDPST